MDTSSQIRERVARWLRSQFRGSIIFLSIFVIFGFWYYEGNNFTDRNIPGTYIADGSGRSDRLTIKADHTYEQDAIVDGQKQQASGVWKLSGNVDAHIVFEGSFLNAPAAAVGRDDHYAFGMFDNLFGFLTLTLQSDTTPLEFHKKYWFF
jgi:hypothetical protein